MTNETNKPQRDAQGNLDSYAWPGGYPVYYVTEDNGVLCPACANTDECKRAESTPRDEWAGSDRDQWEIVAGDVNWEDPALYCENCETRIESAYAEE